jgi:ACR3 family arsenite efflux pump ArsB
MVLVQPMVIGVLVRAQVPRLTLLQEMFPVQGRVLGSSVELAAVAVVLVLVFALGVAQVASRPSAVVSVVGSATFAVLQPSFAGAACLASGASVRVPAAYSSYPSSYQTSPC